MVGAFALVLSFSVNAMAQFWKKEQTFMKITESNPNKDSTDNRGLRTLI